MTEAERQIREKRQQALERAREMLDLVEREGRGFTRVEEKRYSDLEAEVERLSGLLPSFDPRQAQGPLDGENTQREPAVLRAGDSMVAWTREHDPRGTASGLLDELSDPSRFSIGLLARGMTTGRWEGADIERRALSEGVNSAGGFLVPSLLSAVLIDRLRPAMKVMQAGGGLVPMSYDTLFMARLDTGPSPALSWKTEAASIATADNSFSRITFTARTLVFLTLLSRELLEDLTEEAARLIEHELVTALALELDRACLRGSGIGPEPTGVRNQSGVTIQALGTGNGNTPVFDDLVDGVANVRAANAEPSAIIYASRTDQTLAKHKDAVGRYVEPPSSIATIPRLTSNNIPVNLTVGTSSNCSEIYTGDFGQLLIGMRNSVGFELKGTSGGSGFGPRVRVLEERYADTLSAGLLVYLRADVQLAHGAAFNVATGVLP